MSSENGPTGAGRRLTSLPVPQESCWISSVGQPAASWCNCASIVGLIGERLSGLATDHFVGSSSMVGDRAARAGGSCPGL